MIIPYPLNNPQDFLCFFHRVKTGPNWFSVYYKNVATVCLESKEVRAKFGVAKFTDGVKELSKWCEEMIATYNKASDVVSEELVDVDPTANTRMVV